MIKNIIMQGQTLRVLILSAGDMRGVQKNLRNCLKLKELRIGINSSVSKSTEFLENDFRLGIEKLHLGGYGSCDKLINSLVTRCQNLKSLTLSFGMRITDKALQGNS